MNFRNGQPIYIQIAERLMDEILAEKYNSDARIPGVRDYSQLLQVNVNTTTKAFDLLVQRGIIYNKRGLGSFVSPEARERILCQRRQDFFQQQLPDLAQRMRQIGITLEEVQAKMEELLVS